MHRLLERVTEALARELASPGTPQPADWTDTEWSLARAVAVMQGIGPLLAARSAWTGGPGWRHFLMEQHRHTAARYARLVDTATQIGRASHAAGVRLVGLKGLELHRRGLYAAGERPMADVDLLVGGDGYDRAVGILEGLGFSAGIEGWKDHLFVAGPVAPPRVLGEHQDNPVKVELHRHIVERLPWRTVSLPTTLLAPDACAGLHAYPSSAALMLHLLLHAAGNMPPRTLRMIQLHDIAELACRMHMADWQALMAAAAPADLWWTFPPLALVMRYYPSSVPGGVLGALRAHCPGSLARRALRMSVFDASHSYPWVEAVPGIAWSRTVAERFSYLANRVRPPRAVRDKRQALVQSEAWSDPNWSQRGQLSRIVRYLKGPQTRPSTMHAVRLAFEQRH